MTKRSRSPSGSGPRHDRGLAERADAPAKVRGKHLLELHQRSHCRFLDPGDRCACRDGECLRFAYTSRDGIDSRRLVEPHTLVHLARRWYLLAWDLGRGDWRTFRVDRLTRPASAGTRFTPRPLPAKDAATYVERSIAGAPSRFRARVTLHAPAGQITKRLRPHAGTIEAIDEEHCLYETGDDDLAWLALRLAMLGVDFDVHEPPELAEHLQALADRLASAAGSH